jgi:AAA domain
MTGVLTLPHVFGIAERINQESYVDRGGLDAQFRYALGTERHIAIHGESKQGKSWLRSRMLDEKAFVLVQCQHGTSIEGLFTDALAALGVRAELKATAGSELEGTIELTGSAGVRAGFLGHLGIGLKTGGRRRRSRDTESQPFGQTPGNIRWVAEAIRKSGRRLVIEDCHYLTDECFKQLAFLLKALGAYGVHVIVVGIWPQDHLLTYYNGELSSRIEDIHLRWSAEELEEVLQKGCRALNINLTPKLRNDIIVDAGGNVGLLQSLVEQLCREEHIVERQAGSPLITSGPSLDRARHAVAQQMRFRFKAFVENFDSSLYCPSEVSVVHHELLRILAASADEELTEGINTVSLYDRIAHDGRYPIDLTGLQTALEQVPAVQARIAISPPVMIYNRYGQQVFLADQSFLFYRRYGNPQWPWNNLP